MPSKLAAWLSAHPRTMVAGAAVVGTLLAVHPLLLGRSLATPNTGSAMVLYDGPPFIPGSDDTTLEEARGTDVGAMAWAILPYTVVQRRALAGGEWPLWNRYNLAGVPLWGQAQTFSLDPFHIASLLLPDVLLAMDLRFIAARLVFAAGIGLLVLALTGSAGAGVLMALVTPFIGIYTYRLNHPAYFSLTWAPWVLLGYLSLIRAGTTAASARAGVGIALASYLQLVGSTPKEGVITLAAAHAAGAAGLFLARRRWSERLAALDILAVTAAAIVLATAPHWLVFVDGLTRAFTVHEGAYFLAWSQVEAYLLGAATPGLPYPSVHALGAALAAAGLVAGRKTFFTIGCLAALTIVSAIALGAVPASVVARVPLAGNIHHVGLSGAAATIPLVLVLAGTGAAALMDPSTPRWRIYTVVATAVMLALVLARGLPGEPPAPRRLMALCSLAAAVGVIALLPLARRRAGIAWTGAMAVVLTAAVVAGGLTFESGLAPVDMVLTQPRPRADYRVVPPALEPVLAAQATGDPFRVAPYGLMMMAGTQAYWGLEGIGGADAVRLPWIEDLSDLSGVTRTPFIWLTDLNKDNLAAARGFLDLLNVRYLVSRPDNLPPGARPLPSPAPDRISVVERPTAWPRAFFVDGVERHDSLFAFAERLAAADAPFASVDRTEPDAMAAVSWLPERATTIRPARGYHLSVNRTSFTIDATGPGVAALSEAFVDLDFIATLNGTRVPYVRLNHAFKGVVVPAAGEWEVAFEYRPASWTVSWMMAGAGWLAIAGLAAAGWGRRLP